MMVVMRVAKNAQHREQQATKKSPPSARRTGNIVPAMRPVFRFASKTSLWLVAIVAAAVIRLSAEDWPQFLGPERNGVYRGPALAEMWGAEGPRVVWRKNVGQGFSGPVVAQGRLILFHRIGNEEIVDAIDPRTGMSQWRYAYPTSYRDDFGFDEGPRAVPVVVNGIGLYVRSARAAPRHRLDEGHAHLERGHACSASGCRKDFLALPDRRWWKRAACSPTWAARTPESSHSTQRPESLCGPRPKTRRATRRRLERRSQDGVLRSFLRARDWSGWIPRPGRSSFSARGARGWPHR